MEDSDVIGIGAKLISLVNQLKFCFVIGSLIVSRSKIIGA